MNEPIKRPNKFIASLPMGYDYAMWKYNGDIRIVGVHPEKEPIAFRLVSEKLEPIEIVLKVD